MSLDTCIILYNRLIYNLYLAMTMYNYTTFEHTRYKISQLSNQNDDDDRYFHGDVLKQMFLNVKKSENTKNVSK